MLESSSTCFISESVWVLGFRCLRQGKVLVLGRGRKFKQNHQFCFLFGLRGPLWEQGGQKVRRQRQAVLGLVTPGVTQVPKKDPAGQQCPVTAL